MIYDRVKYHSDEMSAWLDVQTWRRDRVGEIGQAGLCVIHDLSHGGVIYRTKRNCMDFRKPYFVTHKSFREAWTAFMNY